MAKEKWTDPGPVVWVFAMQALILEEPRRFVLGERPIPQPGPGEVLVRIRHIGVCGTDIHAWEGNQPFFNYPRVLGHELGVEVVESGPGCGRVQPGDRASVEPYLNNPDSPASRRGKPNCCEDLSVLGVHQDGGMCPLLVVPERKLHVANDLDLEELALVETFCIGAHGVERAGPLEGLPVLVIGAGPIGLGAAQAAQAAGGRVLMVDIAAQRLEFARSMGLEQTLLAEGEWEPRIREAFQGELPLVVMDATGHRGSMEHCLDLAAHGGTILFLGIYNGPVGIHDPTLHKKELAVLSSRNAPTSTFPQVLQQLREGRIALKPWITGRLPASRVPEAFEEALRAPGTVKLLIDMDLEA